MLLAPRQPASTDCEELLARLTQIACARCPKGPVGQPNGRHLCRFAGPSGHLKMMLMLMVSAQKLTCQPIPMLQPCARSVGKKQ